MAGKGNGGGGSAKAVAGRSQGGGSARSSGAYRIERKSKPISGGPSSHSQTSANGTGQRSSMTHHMSQGVVKAAAGMAADAVAPGIGRVAQRANLENAYSKAVNAAASRGDISRNEHSKVANSRPKEGPTLYRERKTKVKKTGY